MHGTSMVGELATAYGYYITTDRAWPLLREASDLKMISAEAPLLTSAPGVTDELHLRLNSVHNGDTNVAMDSLR